MLAVCLIFILGGCGSDNKKNEGELHTKAIAVLDEFKDNQRVKDFRTAYDLLMSLPSDADDFVAQLDEVEYIYAKYGMELYRCYLPNTDPDKIKQEHIEKYRKEGVYSEAGKLMRALVYPVLFEKYGSYAQSIKGINAHNVANAVMSNSSCELVRQKGIYDDMQSKEWKYISKPRSTYSLTYHNNGLVHSVEFPIVRSNIPMDGVEFEKLIKSDPATQKKIINTRIESMTQQEEPLAEGYKVLWQIFTEEELRVLSNYIWSMTVEDIWARDILSNGGKEATVCGAEIALKYKGNHIYVKYGVNDIKLEIIGGNRVNELSHRWAVLSAGLLYPKGTVFESDDVYYDELTNNIAANDVVDGIQFDLDANADKYREDSMQSCESNGASRCKQ